MLTLIKGGRLIDPSQNIDGVCNIVIKDGKIDMITTEDVIDKRCYDINNITVIDASGLVVTPGFVDMHVHLRDPGFTHKGDIESECYCAASGGVTSLVCMPNTKPAIDSSETLEYILDKSKTASARVYPSACITKGLSGNELVDFAQMKKSGAVAVTDDGRPVENAKMMMEAMRLAKSHGLKVISHCEDLAIIDGGIINDGEVSKALGVKGMSRASEDSITAREIALAAASDTDIHIAHVSTWYSTQLVRDAKKCGIKVTAETCPHYFSLTESELLSKDADYRMNPPLREQKDVDAIIEGVIDGTFDCIVTDHAPHSSEEKSDFAKAPNGVIGMETSFSASYTYLVDTGKISLSKLVKLMSTNPAKLLGLNAGSLKVGMPADIAIIDLDKEWVVDAGKSNSKSKNCVYKGKALKAKVVKTLLGGKIVYEYQN